MVSHDVPESTEESRWRSRRVAYHRGTWNELQAIIPEFDLRPFISVPDMGATPVPFDPMLGELANPFFQVVTRRPQSASEAPMPVGIVSRTYSLLQHRHIANLCRQGIIDVLGTDPDELKYELGMSELGEWMNLRIYLPRRDPFVDGGRELTLRLECFNSVDGSSRLVIFFGWFRLVCSNGMVIGETRIRIQERHGKNLDPKLGLIRSRLARAFESVGPDLERMRTWQRTRVRIDEVGLWCHQTLAPKWGPKASVRVHHICTHGRDITIDSPYTEPSGVLDRVPGSPERAGTVYDVSQALSFVATGRRDAEQRIKWQEDIPWLLDRLPVRRLGATPSQKSIRP